MQKITIKSEGTDELPKFINVVDFVNKLDDYKTACSSINKSLELKISNSYNKRHFSQNVENKSFQ